MAEPTLTLTRLDLKNHVGRFLGISRTVADWTAENLADVLAIIAVGERSFYEPSFKRDGPNALAKSYVWSFLSSVTTVTLANGTNAYDLVDDFAGFLDEELAFTTSKTWSLKLVPMWRVLEKIQDGVTMPTGITQPLIAAIRPKVQAIGTTGQRQQILMWPTPTATLTITGRYRSNPSAISDDTYYPMGGEQFAQCLLESCLATAEEFINDQSSVHRERFQELLASAVALDQRLHQNEAA